MRGGVASWQSCAETHFAGCGLSTASGQGKPAPRSNLSSSLVPWELNSDVVGLYHSHCFDIRTSQGKRGAVQVVQRL